MPKGVYKRKPFSLKHIKNMGKSRIGNKNSNWSGGKIKKICLNCERIFEVTKNRKYTAKYCSVKCYYINNPKRSKRSDRVKIMCKECNNRIDVTVYESKTKRYCSNECYYISKKGKSSPMKGKKLSEDHIKMLIASHKGKYGELSSNWKGGLTHLSKRIREIYKYNKWRTQVFVRDKYTCKKCNSIGGKIEAHHIVPFNNILKKYSINNIEDAINCNMLWNIKNGITLCKKCHKSFHSTFGYIKNNIKQINIFINN